MSITQSFSNFRSNFMNIGQIQRQSLISLLTIVAINFLGYLSTIYFAHTLGPAILGAFFLFLAYYGIFDLIGDGGFGGAAIKRISEGKEQNQYFSVYIISRLLLLIVSVAVFMMILPYLTNFQSSDLSVWFIIALVVGAISSIFYTANYGTCQIGIIQIGNLLNTITKIIVQIIAVFLGFAAGGLVAGFIAGMLCAMLINYRYIQLHLTKFNSNHVKKIFSFSFWSFIASGGVLIYTNTDTILLGFFMSESDVGIYRVAFQLASGAAFIVGAFYTVLLPKVSEWHTRGDFLMIENTVSRAITYSLALAIPVTAGSVILSDKLMYFFYGASFQSGSTVLIILCLVQVVNIFMYLQTMCLSAMDMPRKSFIVTGISALLNVILNIILIPVYGIMGAAIATLVTLIINSFYANHLLKPFIKIKLDKKSFTNVCLSSLVMSVLVLSFVYFFPVNNFIRLFIAIAIGCVTYFGFLLTLDNDIRIEIKNIVKTLGIL